MANSSPILAPGATIGVMAPSSYVEKNDIESSAQRLRDAGFSVFIHPQTYERQHQSAGTPLQKALALQGLYQRKDIDVIWFAGGGNHAMELISTLNFERIKNLPPKPLLGFSDTTTLLNAFYHHNSAPNMHAPVFKQIATLSEHAFKTLIDYATGQSKSIAFSADQIHTPPPSQTVITAPLVGGNLSLVQYLPSLFEATYLHGKIVLLEDCNEELSHIDRMLCFLRTSGALNGVKGLLLGQFTKLTDTGRPFGRDLNDIIQTHLSDLNVPTITNLPFGHGSPFTPMPIGMPTTIDFKNHAIEW